MDRQCSSCGGFCKKSGCERENVQPEPEPVAYLLRKEFGFGYEMADRGDPGAFPVYTDPPQREWQGLTDEEVEEVAKSVGYNPLAMTVYEYRVAVQKATEAKLKEKNELATR